MTLRKNILDAYLPINSFVEKSKLPKERVIELIREGQITGHLIDEQWFVLRSDLEPFILFGDRSLIIKDIGGAIKELVNLQDSYQYVVKNNHEDVKDKLHKILEKVKGLNDALYVTFLDYAQGDRYNLKFDHAENVSELIDLKYLASEGSTKDTEKLSFSFFKLREIASIIVKEKKIKIFWGALSMLSFLAMNLYIFVISMSYELFDSSLDNDYFMVIFSTLSILFIFFLGMRQYLIYRYWKRVNYKANF